MTYTFRSHWHVKVKYQWKRSTEVPHGGSREVYKGVRNGMNNICSKNSGEGVLWWVGLFWEEIKLENGVERRPDLSVMKTLFPMLKFSLGDFELTLKWRNTLGWWFLFYHPLSFLWIFFPEVKSSGFMGDESIFMWVLFGLSGASRGRACSSY